MSPDDATSPSEHDGHESTGHRSAAAVRRAIPRLAPAVAVVALLSSMMIPALWYLGAAAPLPFRTPLFWLMTGFVACFGLAIVIFLRLVGREWASSLVLAALVLLVTFSWPALTSVGAEVAGSLGVGIVGDVLPVALAVVAFWLGGRLAGDAAFGIVIGGAVIAYAVVLATIAVPLVTPGPGAFAAREAGPEAPDVVLLVLDGYARSDVLAENFEADISGFLGALEGRGFFVATDAATNYPFTYAAVSTMLAGEYTLDDGPIDDDELDNIRSVLTGNSGMLRDFAAAGYETRYLLNAWAGSHCGGLVDVCVSGGIVGRSLWNLARMTILSPLVDEIWRNPLNNQSVDQLIALDEILLAPSGDKRPVFTFAHVILPHVPLRLAADCTRTDGGAASEWGSQPELRAERSMRYRDQVTCVNTLVIDALDRYLDQRPHAIVMITADHGPGASLNPNHSVQTVPDGALAERMPILSAYRIPGCEDRYRSDLTPVNGARALLACALGADMPPIEDIMRWVDFDAGGVATDITARIGSSPG